MKMKWFLALAVVALAYACGNDKNEQNNAAGTPQVDTAQVAPTKEQPKNPIGNLEKSRWRITRMVVDGKVHPMIDSTQITAVFDGNRVSGSGGCNDYFAAYTKGENNSIQVDSIAHSSRACNRRMGQEQLFFDLLQGAKKYVMPDSLSVEITSDKGEMTLRAIIGMGTAPGAKKANGSK